MSGEIAPKIASKAKAPKASPQNQIVTMSNALTRAGHGLSLSEKRIVAASIAKLDSRVSLGSQGVPFSRLTAAEYSETFGVDLDTKLQLEVTLLRELLQAKDSIIEEQKQRLLLLEDNRQQGTSGFVTRHEIPTEARTEPDTRGLVTRHKKPRTLFDRLTNAADAFLG